ncbi:hypothetical protein F2P56_021780 [Juglans regia]|uniref:Uncharacterized protein n=1 Tax=Juglans regia TaxID=51240 RepID=A0A833UGZ5_JUGRE|nr:hypothetical protein F2P56_021780 [Juglans regia]
MEKRVEGTILLLSSRCFWDYIYFIQTKQEMRKPKIVAFGVEERRCKILVCKKYNSLFIKGRRREDTPHAKISTSSTSRNMYESSSKYSTIQFGDTVLGGKAPTKCTDLGEPVILGWINWPAEFQVELWCVTTAGY